MGKTKFDPILDCLRENDEGVTKEVSIIGGRKKKTTDSYMENESSFMNLVPVYFKTAATLTKIVASCEVAGTWTAEVHNNGVLIPGATLALTAQSEESADYNIPIPAGAKIQLYCNGTLIEKPKILIITQI